MNMNKEQQKDLGALAPQDTNEGENEFLNELHMTEWDEGYPHCVMNADEYADDIFDKVVFVDLPIETVEFFDKLIREPPTGSIKSMCFSDLADLVRYGLREWLLAYV